MMERSSRVEIRGWSTFIGSREGTGVVQSGEEEPLKGGCSEVGVGFFSQVTVIV